MQTADEAGRQLLAAEEVRGIGLVEVLQALVGRVTGFRGEGLEVRHDPRMDPEYWRSLAVTFTRRALTRALERAR